MRYVARDHVLRQIGWHVAPRILQKRYKVEGRRTAHRVLKIKQADAPKPLPLGQPVQIVSVVIEQGDLRVARRHMRKNVAPQGGILTVEFRRRRIARQSR